MRWVVDGNNVMGSRPDGWWRDRTGSLARLARLMAAWSATTDDVVLLVVDHRPDPAISDSAGPDLDVRFADRPGRNAADDVIVDLVEAGDTVVTADRGLRARLPAGVDVVGPRTFLAQLSA